MVPLGDVREVLDNAADFHATAAMLREHAVRVQVSREERGRAAEARATTLLGTVPIAASLVIAGAGLVLDADKITGNWSLAVMGLVALLLIVLLSCAYVASRAVLKSRIQVTNEPRMRQALNWAANADARQVEVKRIADSC